MKWWSIKQFIFKVLTLQCVFFAQFSCNLFEEGFDGRVRSEVYRSQVQLSAEGTDSKGHPSLSILLYCFLHQVQKN